MLNIKYIESLQEAAARTLRLLDDEMPDIDANLSDPQIRIDAITIEIGQLLRIIVIEDEGRDSGFLFRIEDYRGLKADFPTAGHAVVRVQSYFDYPRRYENE